MAEINASMIKELRERTQAGMSDCKAALVEAAGDMDKAVEVILKKGIVKAAARSGRVATEGEVRANVSADRKSGTLVEVNCQTDFVARGDDFKGFVGQVLAAAERAPKGADLGAEKYPGTDKTVDLVRQEMVAKLGENTVVRRWQRVEATEPGGVIFSYIHMGGKLGVLLHAEAPTDAAAKDPHFIAFVENAAMQIAAMSPIVVSKDQLPEAETAKQKEIFEAQLKEEGKPEKAWPKIIEGKVAKWVAESTLLGQNQVWDAEKGGTVDDVRREVAKAVGGEVKLHGFVRFSLGEGIEKVKDDLAAEVAKMTST